MKNKKIKEKKTILCKVGKWRLAYNEWTREQLLVQIQTIYIQNKNG